jgi:hypothetical protein
MIPEDLIDLIDLIEQIELRCGICELGIIGLVDLEGSDRGALSGPSSTDGDL